jgi:hypothetical protein
VEGRRDGEGSLTAPDGGVYLGIYRSTTLLSHPFHLLTKRSIAALCGVTE